MARNPETKAEAIVIGRIRGAIAASKATGIPRRTISRWLTEDSDRDSPVIRGAIVATEDAIADRLWETITLGLEEVRAGLLDPKARLSDKARALEVIANQWQLITGRATTRTENLNVNVEPDLTAHLSPDDQLQLRQIIDAELAQRDNAEALDAALDDPLSLTPAQITGLIRAIEARIGDD